MTELEDTSRYVFSKNAALLTADAKPAQNIDIREHRQVLCGDYAVEHTIRLSSILLWKDLDGSKPYVKF